MLLSFPIRGSVKHHKEGNPLRPIVTCIGSALYNTSKFLTDILSPLQNRNGYSVANSLQFSKELSDIEIDDNEVLVSFNLVSLFTAIPVDKTCAYIKKKLEQDATLSSRTNLDIDNITTLLQFTLSNNYFVCNDRIYKQVHGCAMGSPVSPVVANLCMEEIEGSAICNSSVPRKICKRYVDDSFCIIGKDDVSAFHDTLNSKGHVRYINILTWLRGFQVKLLYLVLFSLYPSLFWELRDKRNLKNLQFLPESLGAMLEY